MNKNIFFLMMLGASMVLIGCSSKTDIRDAARDSLNPQANTTSATATDPTAMTSETPSGPTTTVVFSEERFNFGTVAAGEKVQHNFKIKNTGKEPLIISNASSSCGCTVPEWPKEPIAPGKSGEIQVVFDSNGKSGAQSKRVTIVANTNPPESFLYLEGDVSGGAPQGN